MTVSDVLKAFHEKQWRRGSLGRLWLPHLLKKDLFFNYHAQKSIIQLITGQITYKLTIKLFTAIYSSIHNLTRTRTHQMPFC